MKEIIFRAETDLEVLTLIKHYINQCEPEFRTLRFYRDVLNEANPIGTKWILTKKYRNLTIGKEYEVIGHSPSNDFYVKNDNGNRITVGIYWFKGVIIPSKEGTYDKICSECKSPISYKD